MSRISFEPAGVCRDGRRLHSARDPHREAGLWVTERPSRVRGLVFVLGLGAGFHVREWSRQRPDLCLVAVDFDSDLFRHSKVPMLDENEDLHLVGGGVWGLSFAHLGRPELFRDLLLEQGFSVFRFRPAWVGREAEFQSAEDLLLARTLPTGELAGLPSNLELNIKSLAQCPEWGTSEDRKVILALRELVA